MSNDISHLESDRCFQFETETAEQFLVRNLISKGWTVFDVGANVGDYTILFSQLVGNSGKIYAFEPTSSTFSTLKQRLDEYNCNNVVALQKAVFSSNEPITLNEFPENYSAWNSIGNPQMNDPEDPSKFVPIINTETIDGVSLDSFCRENNITKIDYLKVDVEGAERDVLEGAVHLLERQAIHLIQFEVSKNMLDGLNRTATDVFKTLIRFGYECHRIQDDGEIGETVVDSDAFYENYIAFPHLGADLQSLFGRIPNKLHQARTELEKAGAELQHTQTELQHTQTELQHTQAELQHTQDQRDNVQNKLYQAQIQLAETQAQLSESQHLLSISQVQLQQVQVKLKNTESALERSQERSQRLEGSLENAKSRLDRARDRIKTLSSRLEAMESSKFWKLRKGWFMLKRKLGLKTED